MLYRQRQGLKGDTIARSVPSVIPGSATNRVQDNVNEMRLPTDTVAEFKARCSGCRNEPVCVDSDSKRQPGVHSTTSSDETTGDNMSKKRTDSPIQERQDSEKFTLFTVLALLVGIAFLPFSVGIGP